MTALADHIAFHPNLTLAAILATSRPSTGEYLGPAFTAKPQQFPLYPVVGIDSFAPVRLNFGAEPFVFDVAEVPESLHVTSRRSRVSRCFGSA